MQMMEMGMSRALSRHIPAVCMATLATVPPARPTAPTTVREWASTIEKEGPHTIELITETPFGTERLDYISFGVNRVLKIRSMLTDIE